jgi:hypothetical protein
MNNETKILINAQFSSKMLLKSNAMHQYGMDTDVFPRVIPSSTYNENSP